MFTAIVTADTYRKLAPRTVEREKLSERLVCCKACLGRRNGGGLAGGNRSDAASAAHSTSLIPAATGRFATTISTATATTFWLASGACTFTARTVRVLGRAATTIAAAICCLFPVFRPGETYPEAEWLDRSAGAPAGIVRRSRHERHCRCEPGE